MLTKQKAQKIERALRKGKVEAKIIFEYIEKKRSKLSASSVKNVSAKVREINKSADKCLMLIASSFKNVKEVRAASKYDIIDRLLSDSAELKASAAILANLVDVSDEMAVLPDEGEVIESDEGDPTVDVLPDEAEVVASDDEVVEDEEVVDSEDDMDEEIESEDDEDSEEDEESDDSEDSDEDSEPVKSRFVRARANRRNIGVRASAVSKPRADIWNFGKAGK